MQIMEIGDVLVTRQALTLAPAWAGKEPLNVPVGSRLRFKAFHANDTVADQARLWFEVTGPDGKLLEQHCAINVREARAISEDVFALEPIAQTVTSVLRNVVVFIRAGKPTQVVAEAGVNFNRHERIDPKTIIPEEVRLPEQDLIVFGTYDHLTKKGAIRGVFDRAGIEHRQGRIFPAVFEQQGVQHRTRRWTDLSILQGFTDDRTSSHKLTTVKTVWEDHMFRLPDADGRWFRQCRTVCWLYHEADDSTRVPMTWKNALLLPLSPAPF